MEKYLTLDARYGLKHRLEIIDKNTYRTKEFSRLSYDKIDESGKFINIGFIDFEGGPFLEKGYELPGVKGKVIKEFVPEYDANYNIMFIDIVLE